LAHRFLYCNFHTVEHGQAYRSAQPSGAQLVKLLRRYHIGTVVNLRGVNVHAWYHEERGVTRRYRVAQVDIPFAAGRVPFVRDLLTLVAAFDDSPRPILVHCSWGADRTGLASALFLLLQPNRSLAEARRQLGLCYGSVCLGQYRSARQFLDQYSKWLERHRLAHGPSTFRRWIKQSYCPGIYRYNVEPIHVPDQLVPGQPTTLRVRFQNTSVRRWHFRAGKCRGLRVGYMLQNDQGGFRVEGRFKESQARVDPGRSIEVSTELPALPDGAYRLMVDLVHEHCCWFHQSGCRPLLVDLRVAR
jgi:protein-tyrosine phosphatase